MLTSPKSAVSSIFYSTVILTFDSGVGGFEGSGWVQASSSLVAA